MDLGIATTAPDIGLASIIKGMLESAGIEVVLRGGGESVYPSVPRVGEIEVLVPAEDLELAKELIASAEDDDLEFEAPAEL
jgi:Putative prokaryotic signal transducing protein